MTVALESDDSLDLFVGPQGIEVRAFPEDVRDSIKWQVNLWLGDIPRNRDIGVDYGDGSTGIVFNPTFGEDIAAQEIRGKGITPVPGVVAVPSLTFETVQDRLVLNAVVDANEQDRRERIELTIPILDANG